MSLWGKIMAQHNKSVEQMRQAKQDLKQATKEVKEALDETKQAGQEHFQEAKEHFKMAGKELKNTMEQIKDVWTKRCPNCNSTETKKHKQKVFGLFLLSLFIMIFGTIFLGFLGFLIGSLLMIIPGWRMMKNSFSSKYQCKSCGHIFKA